MNMVEELELRVAELLKERDLYDQRRRDAMAETQVWRTRFHELRAVGREATYCLKATIDSLDCETRSAEFYEANPGWEWEPCEHGCGYCDNRSAYEAILKLEEEFLDTPEQAKCQGAVSSIAHDVVAEGKKAVGEPSEAALSGLRGYNYSGQRQMELVFHRMKQRRPGI